MTIEHHSWKRAAGGSSVKHLIPPNGERALCGVSVPLWVPPVFGQEACSLCLDAIEEPTDRRTILQALRNGPTAPESASEAPIESENGSEDADVLPDEIIEGTQATTGYQPIGQVLAGLEIRTLEPGSTAMGAVVFVHTLDEDGHDAWELLYTPGTSPVELVGAIRIIQRRTEDNFDGVWHAIDPDDE